MSIVAEVRKRLAAASPAPWEDVQATSSNWCVDSLSENREVASCIWRENDAALIASAPTDLARLCDRVEELEAALRPFAAVDVPKVGSIPPREIWLHKPQSSLSDPPGINGQHILDARAAFGEKP